MTSRRYILALIGLMLAAGAGWGAYELRREGADSPGPEAGTADQDAVDHDALGASPAPTSPSMSASVEESQVVVDRPAAREAPAQGAAPTTEEAPEATAVAPIAEPAAGTEPQVGAPGITAEAMPPAGASAPAAAPRTPEPEPAASADVAAPTPPATEEPAPAAPVDRSAGVETAAAGPSAGAETGEGSPPAEAAAGAEAPPPQPEAQKAIALAAPEAPAARGTRPASTPAADLPPPAPPAVAEEPAPDEAERPLPEEATAAAPQPAPSRAVGTIRRALAALFGGAADPPVPEKSIEEPAAPATPPEATAARQENPAGIEPGAAPSFDIVRIQPGGAAVLAGRAAPEAEVEIRSGERVIDRVRADRHGEWVAVPLEPLPAGDQELSLAARVADGPTTASDEVLVVAVPEPPPPQPAPRAGAEPPPPQPPEISVGQAPSEPLAVALPRVGSGQGRILQAPGRISSDGTLALMAVDYDHTGRIRLRGEASPGAPVRIYVDNDPAGAVVVEPSGQWSTVLEPTLAPGDYTLRLDQLGPSGKPTARLETPFTRASQPPVEGDVQVDFVIVQPGNSLWRIARRVFGQGLHYVHIYDANQGQIGDPDLIYPGQVFEIPSGLGAAG